MAAPAMNGGRNAQISPRVVVIGTGPAGVRAAEALVAAGVRPIVIDEGSRDGGQIYRRQPSAFTRTYQALYGSEAEKALRLHRTFEQLRRQIDYRSETLAWNITPGEVHTMCGNRPRTVRYDALIICSGATDRLLPIAGWNLAGCYSLGAAQIALKAQACAIGSRIVFAGTGPLLYLVASQYAKAGANVEAVVDTSPALRSLAVVRPLLARPRVLVQGMRIVASVRRAGIRIWNGASALAIDGDATSGVRGIAFRDASGAARALQCDAVALGFHLRPETQLADLARCAFAFEPVTRQWLPRIDRDGRSSVPNVYLAGDGARILGADGAEAAGTLAALAALRDLSHVRGHAAYDAQAPRLHATLDRMNAFRDGLARAFPWPHAQAAAVVDSTIVCRCEAITAGELRRCARELEAHELNRAKAFSRVGMGRCQGRYCGHAAAEVVAHAAGIPLEQVGRLRSAAPVKPLLMDSLEVES